MCRFHGPFVVKAVEGGSKVISHPVYLKTDFNNILELSSYCVFGDGTESQSTDIII